MITSNQICVCDVCRLIDSDMSKKFCQYCGLCDAWICEKDTNRWGRRLLAAAKRKLEPNYNGLSNYEETIKMENTMPTDVAKEPVLLSIEDKLMVREAQFAVYTAKENAQKMVSHAEGNFIEVLKTLAIKMELNSNDYLFNTDNLTFQPK